MNEKSNHGSMFNPGAILGKALEKIISWETGGFV